MSNLRKLAVAHMIVEVDQHYQFMTESSMSSRVTIYGL
jgi:hypothetical protein